MQGRLGGTGKMVILPVDQGFEHGPARSFAPNPDAYDPHYHYQLAVDAAWKWRFNAGRKGASGEKVEGWVRVPVNFSPDKPADEATAG